MYRLLTCGIPNGELQSDQLNLSRSKLAVLRAECTRCLRKSRYSVRKLIEQ
jgi:hypothetical protein